MAPSAIGSSIITSNGSTLPLSSSLSPTVNSNLGYQGYDHITWYVGNAKQAASYYITRMGFKPLAKRGLETGSRYIASHVVSNGAVTFVLTSPIRSSTDLNGTIPDEDKRVLDEIHNHLAKHGDAVKDVAFEVDDVKAVYNEAVMRGAESIQTPSILTDDANGEVLIAVIKTFGDTTHTLVERSRYTGSFLPGYKASKTDDPMSKLLPSIPLEAIDHCVGNQDWGQMEAICT